MVWHISREFRLLATPETMCAGNPKSDRCHDILLDHYRIQCFEFSFILLYMNYEIVEYRLLQYFESLTVP